MPAAVVKRERKSRPKAEGSNRRRTDPLSDSTDEEANEEKDQADNEKDIKPKLDGVEKEGIDFKYTNEPHGRVRAPDAIAITLQGSKDGVGHKIDLWLPPTASVRTLKKYLCTHHGYSVDKLRLIHNGKICINTDTMASLDVETGDSFDVYLEQLGG